MFENVEKKNTKMAQNIFPGKALGTEDITEKFQSWDLSFMTQIISLFFLDCYYVYLTYFIVISFDFSICLKNRITTNGYRYPLL